MHLTPCALAAKHDQRWPQARGVRAFGPGLRVCVSPSLAPAEEDKCKHCGQWSKRRLSGARQWKNSRCVTKAQQRQVWVQAGQGSRELSLPRGFRCLKPNVS